MLNVVEQDNTLDINTGKGRGDGGGGGGGGGKGIINKSHLPD